MKDLSAMHHTWLVIWLQADLPDFEGQVSCCPERDFEDQLSNALTHCAEALNSPF